ncbi:sulfotransferase family protein [Tropicibacter oceani]|uniref:Sulfotransferase family protein n=1 Tax=Tropicibacter oceani TaxID=3058420 RepID=A0ABY8QPL9_9RHOB|nr:sulfotransferase family protein [Tropicibacter oceani]WGW06047.1 sulfotransferase family protein [Tropicibacter oceani]
MKKTLYIHVGHYKTGTTALQVFLSQNAKKLRRHGLDYTEVFRHHGKHSKFAFSLYRAAKVQTLMHGYKDPTPPEKLWSELFEAVLASPAKTVLISSEEFMRLGAHPAAGARLGDIVSGVRGKIDIRIIAYLRSPAAHLRSWYNQMVKMSAATTDYNTAVCQVMEPVHYDYALALRPWIEIFGAEAVLLRPYQEDFRRDGGLFRDFLSLFGLDYDNPPGRHGWVVPEKDVNPRLDDRLLELTRALHLADVPDDLAHWITHRAGVVLQQQDKDLIAGAQGFDTVAERVRQGLSQLETLPGCAVDLASFQQDLPRPEAPWRADLGLVLATLLREQNLLRDRLQERSTELRTRIAALEARLDRDT